MPFEWDDEVVKTFLLEYQKHECLWNPYHRKFNDCYERIQALTKIVNALNVKVTIQDCLCFLRNIREKYLQKQAQNHSDLRSGCGEIWCSRWQSIVEEMLEKIICDEEQCELKGNRRRNPKGPKVSSLFRHTISSSKKRKESIPAKFTRIYCNERNFSRGKNKKNKKKCRGKLDNRFYSDVEKKMERNNCRRSTVQDCTSPQSTWARQRESYLDNVTWSRNDCVRTVECPAYSSHLDRLSRVENLCAEPSAPYACLNNRSNQCAQRNYDPCAQRNYEGRKRNSDIQPTMPAETPRSCKSAQRHGSATCRKPSPCRKSSPTCEEKLNPCDRKRSREKLMSKSSEKSSVCCPCPDPKEKKSKEKCNAICVDENPSPQKKADPCVKATCPNYQRNKADASSSTCPNRNPWTDIQPQSPNDCSKNVRFDPCKQDQYSTSTPRVAAKFENGVLEGYSQFKVVFPSRSDQQEQCKSSSCKSIGVTVPQTMTQKVQTDRTTRNCAVSVCSEEFRPKSAKNCCSKQCPSRRNMQVGTDDCTPDPCQENAAESLELVNTLHDFVLLTPGGKYVPLVRTQSDCNEKMDYTECCTDGGNRPQPREPDICENASMRCREKQVQSTSEEDKCAATTTKLLLRCLEQMLNLEEQEEKGKCAEVKEDTCDPCKRNVQDRRYEIVNKTSTGCMPSMSEKQQTGCKLNTSSCSPRGKLTHNFLEILKCALDLDNSKKDECDDDGHRQDCCECPEFDCDINERPTQENCVQTKSKKSCNSNDQSVQCEIIETCDKYAITIPSQTSCQEIYGNQHAKNKKAPCLWDPDAKKNRDACNTVQNLSKSRPCTSPQDENAACRTSAVTHRQRKIFRNGHSALLEEKIVEKKSKCKEVPVSEVHEVGVQEKILSSSKWTQCCDRRITRVKEPSAQRRDTVSEYLERCANHSQKNDRIAKNLSCQPVNKESRVSRCMNRDSSEVALMNASTPVNKVCYVSNQYYRSFVVRSPPRQPKEDECLQQYRRTSSLKKAHNPEC